MANKNPVKKFTSETGRRAGQKSSRALPPDIKSAREAFVYDVEEAMYKYLSYTKEDIVKATRSVKTKALDLAILSIIHKAIVHGDTQRLDFLLNRTIGKVPERVQQTSLSVSMNTDDPRLERIKRALVQGDEFKRVEPIEIGDNNKE